MIAALETRAALHGVARRQRRAARRGGRHRPAAPGGQLQARARRRRPRSSWPCRQALEEAAPDLAGMDVEGVLEPEEPLGDPAAAGGERRTRARAVVVHASTGRARCRPRSSMATEVAGAPLVVANVEGTLLAYRNALRRLRRAASTRPCSRAGALACPACGRSYFLPRAGRSLDDDRLQLEPVPLLRERGLGDRSPSPRERERRRPRRLDLSQAAAGRRRAEMVSGLRTLSRTARRHGRRRSRARSRTGDRCDLCEGVMPDDHRHLLNLDERQIVCACESCWALRSGDPSCAPSGGARSGSRTSSCPTRSGPPSGSRSGSRSSCTAA